MQVLLLYLPGTRLRSGGKKAKNGVKCSLYTDVFVLYENIRQLASEASAENEKEK